MLVSDGLRLLTFNTALLRSTVGPRVVAEVRHKDVRLPGIVTAILACTADVVCLQEIFDPDDVELLRQGVRETYPFATAGSRRRRLGVDHGLLTLSRFALRDVTTTPFRAGPPEERPVMRKSFTTVGIDPWDTGERLTITNVHTTAGARRGTESPAANRFRGRQLVQLASALAAEAGPGLVCGDFNAGPQASADNYASFGALGFHDAVLELDDPPREDALITWDPDNPLVGGSRFESSPPQRIDHVFLDDRALDTLRVASVKTVFGTERVVSPDGPIPLSDHRGLLVELRRRGRREG